MKIISMNYKLKGQHYLKKVIVLCSLGNACYCIYRKGEHIITAAKYERYCTLSWHNFLITKFSVIQGSLGTASFPINWVQPNFPTFWVQPSIPINWVQPNIPTFWVQPNIPINWVPPNIPTFWVHPAFPSIERTQMDKKRKCSKPIIEDHHNFG